MKNKIETMLAEAYRRLGIQEVQKIQKWVADAVKYLEQDREHYIETVDSDKPEYYSTIENGVICHMVPLAQEIIQDQLEDHIREHKAVFSLMVAGEEVRYVYEYSYGDLYSDPSMNTYSYSVCRYTELDEIRKELCADAPDRIRPVSTASEWEVFGHLFMAFVKFGKELHINAIPHKTERAMLAASHARPEELTVDGSCITGKLVPIAREHSLWEELREDHRYSYRKELCLLISEDAPKYLLKTHHVYHYFRKVILDDAPGGCVYEPTEEKQEITYEFVTLEDVPQRMYPLYY